jgi:hypothetical protein
LDQSVRLLPGKRFLDAWTTRMSGSLRVRGGARLAAEVKAFRVCSDGAHKQTVANKYDIL